MYGLMAQNFVGDREDALGLGKRGGISREADHPVIALFALLELLRPGADQDPALLIGG